MGTEGTPAYLLWGMRPRPQWLSKMDRLAGSEPRRGERPAHSLPQIPRLKCGWLRLWFRFTGGRHCLLDGEGQGLLSPVRRQSLTNRRVALRGPAPRAKPAGAPPHPWGFLPRIKSGVGGNPDPLAGEDRLPRKLPSMILSEPLQCPIAGFGLLRVLRPGAAPRVGALDRVGTGLPARVPLHLSVRLTPESGVCRVDS